MKLKHLIVIVINTHLVKTTSGDHWEFAPGLYLVEARDKKQARKLTENELAKHADETITEINKIEDLLKKGSVKNILAGRFFMIQFPQVE